jgi:hypothetical protein
LKKLHGLKLHFITLILLLTGFVGAVYSQPQGAAVSGPPPKSKVVPRSSILQIPPFVDAAKAILRTSLFDYESARFLNVRVLIHQMTVKVDQTSDETMKVPTLYFCGKFNGKNQFGAYTGYADFVVVPEQGIFAFTEPSDDVTATLKAIDDSSAMMVLSFCRGTNQRYGNATDYATWFQSTSR